MYVHTYIYIYKEAFIIFYSNMKIFAKNATTMLAPNESCSFSLLNIGHLFFFPLSLSLLYIEGLDILFTIRQNFHLICVIVLFKNPFSTSLT